MKEQALPVKTPVKKPESNELVREPAMPSAKPDQRGSLKQEFKSSTVSFQSQN